ncbi:hypothetical protein Poly51_39030 [Rubripirellula tenax]|uniref:Uncharacterized protein n=1 Tax=Rubripirellula tenax TaxID=2528015 RepID=A0A5C6ETG2_9BACT|nr:hypothetical protein Poly51_39030 [Rubripirellula tenax]
MKIGSCRLTTQRRRSKLGELTTTNIDRTALWATWPPKISLHLAGLARPDEALVFSLPGYQKRGAGQPEHGKLNIADGDLEIFKAWLFAEKEKSSLPIRKSSEGTIISLAAKGPDSVASVIAMELI